MKHETISRSKGDLYTVHIYIDLIPLNTDKANLLQSQASPLSCILHNFGLERTCSIFELTFFSSETSSFHERDLYSITCLVLGDSFSSNIILRLGLRNCFAIMSNLCEFQELRVGITGRPPRIMSFNQHWSVAGTLTERVMQSYYRANTRNPYLHRDFKDNNL